MRARRKPTAFRGGDADAYPTAPGRSAGMSPFNLVELRLLSGYSHRTCQNKAD
jgi:hypothetical protein